MSREEEFRSVPRATRGMRSVEMRAQKQVVSGQSVLKSSHSHANKTHFLKKGCTPSLILKVRVFGNRKWPTSTLSSFHLFAVFIVSI